MRPSRWVLVSVVGLGLAVCTMVLEAPPASAHAFLVSSSPQPGARLQSSPSLVRLRYTEPVAGGVKVALRILNGATVGVGTPGELQGGLIVEAAIPPLRVGVYLVSWEVTAQDGHVSFGEFGFAVGGSGGVPGVVAESGGIAWAQAGAGWIYLLGLFLALDARGTGSSGGGSLLATEPGLLAFVQAGAVAYGLSLVVREASRPAALIPLGGALVAAAASGHAATAAWWAVPVDAVHLAAVGLWTGGLAHVGVVAWRIRGEAPGLIWV